MERGREREGESREEGKRGWEEGRGGAREPMAGWNHPCMVVAPPQQPISYLHYRLSTSSTIALREISRWPPQILLPPAPDRAASGNRLETRKQNIQYREGSPRVI